MSNSTDLYQQLAPQLTTTAQRHVEQTLADIHQGDVHLAERIACLYLQRLLEDPSRAEPAAAEGCCRDGWRYDDVGRASPCPTHHRTGGQERVVSRERQQLTAELMPGKNQR